MGVCKENDNIIESSQKIVLEPIKYGLKFKIWNYPKQMINRKYAARELRS